MKKKVKIAFLDRDGVLNSNKINKGYIGSVKDFKWIPGAKKTIKYLRDRKYKIIIVTNQSGVARGYFTLKQLNTLHKHLQNDLKKFGTKVDRIYFCPFHPDGIIKKFKIKSSLRKPNIGMFNLAKKKFYIDKKNSFIIGDRKVDMLFARKAGIKGYLFNTKNLYEFTSKRIN